VSASTLNVLLILNPHAGGGRARRLEQPIRRAFADQGIAVELLLADQAGAARRFAADRGAGVDVLACAGGDGTLFEVVNGLCELPLQQRPVLAVLPLGTGNAFARDLGLQPGAWRDGVSLACTGAPMPVDLAHASCGDDRFHYINTLGCGFAVVAGLAASRCKWLGRAAYTVGTLCALPRLQAYPLRLEMDGEPLELEATLAMVCNSRYTGTRFLVAPGARLDDGLLDLTIVRAVSRSRLLRLFPRVYDGSHVALPEVMVRRARKLHIHAPAGLALSPDGEFRGATPVTVECVPAALRVCMWAGNEKARSSGLP
jgi:diacylglycerol kinase (ATP)